MNGHLTTDKQLKPLLREVAPLTWAICWGYAVTNLLLGLGMYFLYSSTVAPIAVASILSYDAWGLVYGAIGVVGTYGLLGNHWAVVKRCQLAGLSVKAVWAIALIIRCFIAPQTILITVVWLFFAFIQAMVYIFFIPTGGGASGDR